MTLHESYLVWSSRAVEQWDLLSNHEISFYSELQGFTSILNHFSHPFRAALRLHKEEVRLVHPTSFGKQTNFFFPGWLPLWGGLPKPRGSLGLPWGWLCRGASHLWRDLSSNATFFLSWHVANVWSAKFSLWVVCNSLC